MQMGARAVNVSGAGAGTAYLAVTGSENQDKAIVGARLAAAAATATMLVQEKDGSGRELLKLVAAANASDESVIPINFKGNIFVTVTGAGAAAYVYEA